MPGLCRFAEPFFSLLRILLSALSFKVHVSQIVLGQRVTTLRGYLKPAQCFTVVLAYTLAFPVHQAKVILSVGVTVLCRFSVPLGRFAVILPDTPEEEAREVIQRIVAVLGHAEFHLTEEICQPIGAWVEAGLANRQPGDTADGLIGKAVGRVL